MPHRKFKHIAILVPAVAKSFHANDKNNSMNMTPAYNKGYNVHAPNVARRVAQPSECAKTPPNHPIPK